MLFVRSTEADDTTAVSAIQAMASFEELQVSTWQNKTIGSSAQAEDSYQCECRYDPGPQYQRPHSLPD